MANPQHRVFAACPRYVQGPGAIELLAAECRAIGQRPLVIIDTFVRDQFGKQIFASFADPGLPVIAFSGEITIETVEHLRADAEQTSPDVIVAVGGGKALDAGKAVALRLDLPFVSVPTIASMDGPASRGIAIYDYEHRLALVEQLRVNPDVVLVDTAIIAGAPVAFLRAGIGDAIAKKFEAEASAAARGLNKHGSLPLHSALIAADGAYRLLRKHGAAAVGAVARGKVTEDVEATVEAAILLSALGFENAGLSVAHSFTRGLVKARAAASAPHGFHVAYGLLVQFAIENRTDAEILDIGEFFNEVGLPRRLGDMGLVAASQSEIQAMCELTLTAPHINNLVNKTTLAGLVAAVGRVELLAG